MSPIRSSRGRESDGGFVSGQRTSNLGTGRGSSGPVEAPLIIKPSITSPANNATGISDSTNLTITNSGYSVEAGDPGSHLSTDWQIVRGSKPLISSNTISTASNTSANFSAGTGATYNNSSGSSDRRCIAIYKTDAVTGVSNARIWAWFQNGKEGHGGGDYNVYYTEDNGANWTDDTSRAHTAEAHNWSPGGYAIDNKESNTNYNWPAVVQFDNGSMWCNIYGNKMNPSNNCYKCLFYNATTDTWSSSSETSTNVYSHGLYAGHPAGIHNNHVVYCATNNFGGMYFNPATTTTIPSPASWCNDIRTIAFNGSNLFFGKYDTDNNDKWFTCNSTTDLQNNITQLTDSSHGTSKIFGTYWVPQISKFLNLCAGGTIVLFDPSNNSFEAKSTGQADVLSRYTYDGLNHIISTGTYKNIFTTDFETFIIDSNTSDTQIHYYGGTGGTNQYWGGRLLSSPSAYSVAVVDGTVPTAGASLSLSGGQTDGFTVGSLVESWGGLPASGPVASVNNTTVSLTWKTGNWTSDSTQKVAAKRDSYRYSLDKANDTTDLLSTTFTSAVLESGQTYYVRCRMNSSNNVTSDWSDWSKFST